VSFSPPAGRGRVGGSRPGEGRAGVLRCVCLHFGGVYPSSSCLDGPSSGRAAARLDFSPLAGRSRASVIARVIRWVFVFAVQTAIEGGARRRRPDQFVLFESLPASRARRFWAGPAARDRAMRVPERAVSPPSSWDEGSRRRSLGGVTARLANMQWRPDRNTRRATPASLPGAGSRNPPAGADPIPRKRRLASAPLVDGTQHA
jgi:hypothetical protein